MVLGDPEYYGRFGFGHDTKLRCKERPAGSFRSLVLNGEAVSGKVTYHQAFEAR